MTAVLTWYGKFKHPVRFLKDPELTVYCTSDAFALIHKTGSPGRATVTVMLPDSSLPDTSISAVYHQTGTWDLLSYSANLPFAAFRSVPAHWFILGNGIENRNILPENWPTPVFMNDDEWVSPVTAIPPLKNETFSRKLNFDKLRILFIPAVAKAPPADSLHHLKERFDFFLISGGVLSEIETLHTTLRPYYTIIPETMIGMQDSRGPSSANRLYCGSKGLTFSIGKNHIPRLVTGD